MGAVLAPVQVLVEANRAQVWVAAAPQVQAEVRDALVPVDCARVIQYVGWCVIEHNYNIKSNSTGGIPGLQLTNTETP